MKKIVIIGVLIITPYLMGLPFRQSVAQKATQITVMPTTGGRLNRVNEQRAKLQSLVSKAKTADDYNAIKTVRKQLSDDLNRIDQQDFSADDHDILKRNKMELEYIEGNAQVGIDKINAQAALKDNAKKAKIEKKQAKIKEKQEAKEELQSRTVNKVKVGPRIGGKRLSFGGDVIKEGDYRSVMKAAKNRKGDDTKSSEKILVQSGKVQQKLEEASQNIDDLKKQADEATQTLLDEKERTKFETSGGKTLTTGRKIVRFFKPDGKAQVVREAEQNLREANNKLRSAEKARAKLTLLKNETAKLSGGPVSNVNSAVNNADDDSYDEFSSTSNDDLDTSSVADDSGLMQPRSRPQSIVLSRTPSVSRRASLSMANNDNQLQDVPGNAPDNVEPQQALPLLPPKRPSVRVAPPFPGPVNVQPKPIANAQLQPVDEAPAVPEVNQAPDAPQVEFTPPPPPPPLPEGGVIPTQPIASSATNIQIASAPKRSVQPIVKQQPDLMAALKAKLKDIRPAIGDERPAPVDDTEWN